MKVEQVMTPSPATCGVADNLAQVVERMWTPTAVSSPSSMLPPASSG